MTEKSRLSDLSLGRLRRMGLSDEQIEKTSKNVERMDEAAGVFRPVAIKMLMDGEDPEIVLAGLCGCILELVHNTDMQDRVVKFALDSVRGKVDLMQKNATDTEIADMLDAMLEKSRAQGKDH